MKTRTICIAAAALAALLLVFGFGPASTAQAAQAFTFPQEVKPVPVFLLNGSFQTPEIAGYSSNYGVRDGVANSLQGWKGTASTIKKIPTASLIDILKVQLGAPNGLAAEKADGTQYAEVSSIYPSRLYQAVGTAPGTRLVWQFAHRARRSGANTAGTGADVLNFYLRAGGKPEAAPKKNQLILTSRASALAWRYRRGVYTVPAGQNSTELSFLAVSSATGNKKLGNFVDDVKLQTGAALIAKTSVKTFFMGDATINKGGVMIVTTTITNWGQTNASRCVLHSILGDGLTYVEGSARVNSESVGKQATYDSATGELQIRFGEDADDLAKYPNGGILHAAELVGSGLTSQGESITVSFEAKVTAGVGSIVKVQPFITFNDEDFESVEDTLTAYSSVYGKTPVEGDESTYVNQVKVVS